MAGLYATYKYDFDYVYSLIKTFSKVKINDISSSVVLITDKEFLIRNLPYINKTLVKKTYIAFGTPNYLKEFNIEFVDDKPITKASLKSLVNKKTKQSEIIFKKIDLIKKTLKKSKKSVIKDLSTILYKIQNKELRAKYKNCIFNYLNSEVIDIKKLENSLILLSKKKSSSVKELITIINSEIFSNTHDAVICTKKGLELKDKISSFDINYILTFNK